ncbi:MAG TPA: lytic transglycosylase domain-containing protein [Candidatus Acidoferrales bacterium]|jgi:soluble lytic murein transglycosylase-like protein|nr:lytic transglycosylase domain-containing protein [Candidatus Acidoferrales bacterium]
MRSLSSSVVIVLATLVIWAVPAQGQIVSYRDDSGKRVFINSNPDYKARPVKVVLPKGFTALGNVSRTTQESFAESPEMSAAELANREKIEQMIREVSDRYRVDPALVRAVIQTESNWNSSAISRKGARGLMQLVPGTAQQLGVSNAFDPKQNLDGGVRYLHTLLERYNGDLDKALAAYNAGPGAVDRAGGIPRYRETREYVQKVTDSYFRPGSDRLPRAFEQRRPIYRAVEANGRVVFTNE